MNEELNTKNNGEVEVDGIAELINILREEDEQDTAPKASDFFYLSSVPEIRPDYKTKEFVMYNSETKENDIVSIDGKLKVILICRAALLSLWDKEDAIMYKSEEFKELPKTPFPMSYFKDKERKLTPSFTLKDWKDNEKTGTEGKPLQNTILYVLCELNGEVKLAKVSYLYASGISAEYENGYTGYFEYTNNLKKQELLKSQVVTEIIIRDHDYETPEGEIKTGFEIAFKDISKIDLETEAGKIKIQMVADNLVQINKGLEYNLMKNQDIISTKKSSKEDF